MGGRNGGAITRHWPLGNENMAKWWYAVDPPVLDDMVANGTGFSTIRLGEKRSAREESMIVKFGRFCTAARGRRLWQLLLLAVVVAAAPMLIASEAWAQQKPLRLLKTIPIRP